MVAVVVVATEVAVEYMEAMAVVKAAVEVELQR